ncbi:MAG: hypothetical protein WKF52_04755 [Sphingomicrobium sp.]
MANLLLARAGLVGIATAIVHGLLTDRLMVRPLDRQMAQGDTISATIRRIVPPLLQYSTYSWLIGGFALLAVASGWQPQGRLAIGLLVGASYLYGAIANAWGTRGRHPGDADGHRGSIDCGRYRTSACGLTGSGAAASHRPVRTRFL